MKLIFTESSNVTLFGEHLFGMISKLNKNDEKSEMFSEYFVI